MVVPPSGLTLEEKGHAGVKDLSELRDIRFRPEAAGTIITLDFGDGSHLSVTYSGTGAVAKVESENVRFERLGKHVFVSKDG